MRIALLFLVVACAPAAPVSPAGVDHPYLVAPFGGDKGSTGYYSNVAVEFDAEIQGRLALEGASSHVEDKIHKQLDFAERQLGRQDLHVSLDLATYDYTARTEGELFVVDYRASAQIVVRNEVLDTLYGGAEGFIGRSFSFELPADPERAFDRARICAPEDAKVERWSFEYYFEPERPGCREAARLQRGTLIPRAELPPNDAYPEYDRLAEDLRLDVVVFFRYEGDGGDDDYGLREWRDFRRVLLRELSLDGPADEETGLGERLVGSRDGIETVVRLFGPAELARLDFDDGSALFQRQGRSNEVVMYNGHAYYGNFPWFNSPLAYAPDRYQIFFLDNCYSYGYYTNEVLRHKATPEDPTGWSLVDVVNDTDYSWFRNMADFSLILFQNLRRGTERGGADGERAYHWGAIMDAMNTRAAASAEAWGSDVVELLGVSGVRTNRFRPGGPVPVTSCDFATRPDRFDREAPNEDAESASQLGIQYDDGALVSMQGSVFPAGDVDWYTLPMEDTSWGALDPWLRLRSPFISRFGLSYELCAFYERHDAATWGCGTGIPTTLEGGQQACCVEYTPEDDEPEDLLLDVASLGSDDSGNLQIRVRALGPDAACGFYDLTYGG